LDTIARIRARSFKASHRNLTGQNNPPLSTPWSGLRDARYTPFRIPLPGDLAVTEIHYNPDPPSTAELAVNPGWDSGSFEFVELFNVSGTTLDLFGCRFTKGIQFQFASNAPSVLPPGARFLLVADSAAFVQRYGIRPEVAGVYQNALANDGDSLRLENFHGIELFDFSYNDSWYPVTDGLGYSLVLRHSALPEAVWDERTSWRASALSRGSPGSEDPLPVPLPLVVVNEVLTHTDLPQLDAIELHNPGNSPAPIGGWWISDDRGVPSKYRLPTGTEIPAGGYLAIDESAFNRGDAGAAAFRFSALGDEVWLFAADASGAVLPYSHGFDFGAAQNGVSFGRYINSVGQEMFPAQASLTLGAANSRPRVGPVVLNEIHYHPPDILSGTNRLDNTQDEFIELHNLFGGFVRCTVSNEFLDPKGRRGLCVSAKHTDACQRIYPGRWIRPCDQPGGINRFSQQISGAFGGCGARAVFWKAGQLIGSRGSGATGWSGDAAGHQRRLCAVYPHGPGSILPGQPMGNKRGWVRPLAPEERALSFRGRPQRLVHHHAHSRTKKRLRPDRLGWRRHDR
ncbi:MAG: lamin tail domain-containing protein, partial [Verrucomicrobia bacterium]|nr:lamin tail domain-containing protein [Verrucomicrobiota bacterium]